MTVVLLKQNWFSDRSCLQPNHWTKRAAPWMKYGEISRPIIYHRANSQENQNGVQCLSQWWAYSCSSPLVPHGCPLPWNLPAFDTLNFPILLCKKRHIIHLFIQQRLLLLLQNYPFHFAGSLLPHSLLILHPLEIPLIYFYFLSNFNFVFCLSYSNGFFNIFQFIL